MCFEMKSISDLKSESSKLFLFFIVDFNILSTKKMFLSRNQCLIVFVSLLFVSINQYHDNSSFNGVKNLKKHTFQYYLYVLIKLSK